MPDVAIVVDTTHYMPRQMVEDNGMHQVSLYVNSGDEHEREIDMPDFDAFYERLRSAAQLPTTSQPSIGDFLSVYEPLVEGGQDIVSVHLSGGISGTVESARQAAADLLARKPQRRIEVVDTRSACGAIGLDALAGAAAARAGGDIDAVTARVRASI
jgi:DegV family protein with EDD domain